MKNKKIYIEFLNKEKKFTKDIIFFKNYNEALDWAKKNLEKFNIDIIKITN
jgi:CO dehydrogenase/acetyl-CoA synthase delta subunit